MLVHKFGFRFWGPLTRQLELFDLSSISGSIFERSGGLRGLFRGALLESETTSILICIFVFIILFQKLDLRFCGHASIHHAQNPTTPLSLFGLASFVFGPHEALSESPILPRKLVQARSGRNAPPPREPQMPGGAFTAVSGQLRYPFRRVAK